MFEHLMSLAGTLVALVPLHLGGLHPFEKLLVALIAFGPFVVLFGVVYVVRRRDLAEEQAERTDDSAG